MANKKDYYAMQLEYQGGVELIVWHHSTTDNWTVIGKYPVSLVKISNLSYPKFKELITKGDWVYFTRREASYLMYLLDLPALTAPSCPTCANGYKGYIALSSFYVGCPDCNPDDKGRYTAFELNEKVVEDTEEYT